MLAQGIVPVICPLGRGAGGQVYNINADTAAASLAKALKARKLAFVSDVPGLLRDPADPTTLIQTLRVEEAPALVEAGIVGGGMLPKVQSCIEAIRAGVGKVHMVDGRMTHSLLLEIFTKTGVGTEIIGS
jgi:acetylglutamate kinase